MPNLWDSRLHHLSQQLSKQFLNLFLAPNCPLCDRTSSSILCEFCQKQLLDSQLVKPDRYWQSDFPLFAWGKYEGAVKRSIAMLKYEGHQEIATLYGEWLGNSWQKFQPLKRSNQLIALPIPLHREKMATRGFNQAELIARSFCQITGAKLDLSLQRTRSTAPQFSLSKSARQENVAGAFAIDSKSKLPQGATVLLIDDIYTTGATVRSAADVLRSHKLNVLGVAVIATTKD